MADAVVIGNRIIQELENTPKEQGPQAVRGILRRDPGGAGCWLIFRAPANNLREIRPESSA